MSYTFTDAEQRFADSAEGAARLAYERSKYEMGEAYKGANAIPWTDGMEANVVRRLTRDQARSVVTSAARTADAERQLPQLRAEAEAARRRMIADLNISRRC